MSWQQTTIMNISNLNGCSYTKAMSNLKAAGAYLWALREEQELSRADVAVQVGTSDVQLMRIEKGEIDTRGSMLMSLLRVLRGNANQVETLILDQEATEQQARDMASSWLKELNRAHYDIAQQLAAEIPVDQAKRALEVIRRLRDPARTREWLDLGQWYIDRQPPPEPQE